jgi:hypothetical protein
MKTNRRNFLTSAIAAAAGLAFARKAVASSKPAFIPKWDPNHAALPKHLTIKQSLIDDVKDETCRVLDGRLQVKSDDGSWHELFVEDRQLKARKC